MNFAKLWFSGLIIFGSIHFTNAQISSCDLLKTDKYLSSKKLAGRLPGSLGYEIAAKFMADQFLIMKLHPISGTNYSQKVKVEYNEILAPEHLAVVTNGKRIAYKLGSDYVYRGFTGAGKLTAQVVFCGYGLSQPELGYDDFANVDVKNKVVVAFKYNPKWNIKGKTFTNGNPREKAIVAAKHGAVGILFTSFPKDMEPQKPIGSMIHGEGEQMQNFPEVHIDLHVADELFNGSGSTLKELQTKIDSSKSPFSISLMNQIDLEVHTKYEKQKEVENIVGILEGSDARLKNEFLIIGAHLDHVGSQAGKLFFPGANDNASGSSALLEIAKAFTGGRERPKRSIAFVFFASEEQGLNGSTFFAEHLPFPKERVKAMINLDCIGFGDSIQVNGGKNFPGLWNVVKQIDSLHDNLLTNNTGNGGGADAEPFFKIGIPTLYFVTTNSYKHLHLPTDTTDTLNKKLFEAISNLAFQTAVILSNK
jgi:hypothetical protein